VIGADPDFSHPVLALKLKKAANERRTQLVLIGPHATGLSPYATCEVRHPLGEERQVLELLQQRLRRPESAEPSGDLGHAAGILEKADSVAVLYGTGLMRRLDGVANRELVADVANALSAKVLPLLSGANDRGAREIGASFGSDGLTTPEILLAARSGELDLLYLMGQDIWLGGCETKFVVVQDMFLPTEAGKIADVVLPAASFAETDGTYTNFEGRVQRLRQVVEPTVVSKPDWEILSLLARELAVAGFEHAKPSEIMTELADSVPFYSGATHEALEKEGAFFGNVGASGNGGRSAAARPGRAPQPEKPDKDYPFALAAEFDEYVYRATPLGSEVRGLARLEGAASVALSLRDAEALGVGPGSPVKVVSRRGLVVAKAVPSEGVQEGTARMIARSGDASPTLVVDVLLDPVSRAPEEICAVRIEKM
jgi:predicted molibdopterin-dependent oxidoreductase YjgC